MASSQSPERAAFLLALAANRAAELAYHSACVDAAATDDASAEWAAGDAYAAWNVAYNAYAAAWAAVVASEVPTFVGGASEGVGTREGPFSIRARMGLS